MFTLSGAHVFPMYDGAARAEPPLRLVDVRHEQTAVFAASVPYLVNVLTDPEVAYPRKTTGV